MSREAMQQALGALELAKLNGKAGLYPGELEEITGAIAALRAALAEQAQPVAAYKVRITGRWHEAEPTAAAFNLPDGEHLLYTTPPAPVVPQRLTDEDIRSVANQGGWDDSYQSLKFARAIETETIRRMGGTHE